MHTRTYRAKSGQKASQRRGRSRRSVVLIVLGVLIAYFAWAYLAVPSEAFAGEVKLADPPSSGNSTNVLWPNYGEAALGTQAYGVFATHGKQTPAPTASIAKIVTALSVLQQRPLVQGEQGPTLTLTQADVDLYNMYIAKDGSVAMVADGEQISEYQALEAMLLPSANNMADTLANWAFGSMAAYTTYANTFVKSKGLDQTHISDASGFSPQTTSTATDLVKIGQLALDNAVIAEIVAKPRAQIPVAGTINNVNHLLEKHEGFIGIKTGNTDEAGGCMLFAAKYKQDGQSIVIIGAIQGAPHLYDALVDSSKLLDSARNNFVKTSVVLPQQVVGSYQLPWGGKVDVVADQGLTALTWRGADVSTKTVLRTINLPRHKGDNVGHIEEILNSPSVESNSSRIVPVSLAQDVTGPSLWWRMTHPYKTWQLHAS